MFFLILYKGFIYLSGFYLTFIEGMFSFLIRCKIIKFDFLHFTFFTFFMLTNLIFFFFDPSSFEKNLLKYFSIFNSNFFNYCYLLCSTQNPYSETIIFNNNSIFFKNIIIYEYVFLEFFSSSNKFLINLNLSLLLKITIFVQICLYYSYSNKKIFLY